MHESDKAELRRLIARALQKDFHTVTPAQFEQWSQQVLAALAALEHSLAQANARLAALEARLARLEGGPGGAPVREGEG
ncbi:MAG: hypothetical protein IT317_22725 [Anaerolineales bacterium]|nr:hypothetical protein [Anaerolineales bacterium]